MNQRMYITFKWLRCCLQRFVYTISQSTSEIKHFCVMIKVLEDHLPFIHFAPPPCLLIDFKNSK